MTGCPTCHATWVLRAVEDTELFVRAPCACERRRECGSGSRKVACRDPVTCVVVEADGVTVDSYACATHGYETEDTPYVERATLPRAAAHGVVPVVVVPPPIKRRGQDNVARITCVKCGEAHYLGARTLVVVRQKGTGVCINRTRCPCCDDSVLFRYVETQGTSEK